MEPSPPTRPMGRASIAVWVAIGLLLIAGVLSAVKTTWAPLAHADAQPTVTIVLKPGASTSAQSVYTVTASGFAPQVSITQTLGDGSAVPPIAGHTNASGMFTSWWTLEVASKYCGTITAKTDTAQASASFWVAPPSDPSSGTACAGTAGGGNTNPPPAATAAATAAPSHASPVATSAAQQASPLPSTTPTAADSTAPGFSLRTLTAHLPWRWIGLGGVAVLGLIVVVAVASGRKPKSPPRRGHERASGQGRAVYGRGQQAGMGGGAGMRGGAAAFLAASITTGGQLRAAPGAGAAADRTRIRAASGARAPRMAHRVAADGAPRCRRPAGHQRLSPSLRAPAGARSALVAQPTWRPHASRCYRGAPARGAAASGLTHSIPSRAPAACVWRPARVRPKSSGC